MDLVDLDLDSDPDLQHCFYLLLFLYRPTSVSVQLSTGQNLRVLQDKVGVGV